MINEEKTTEAFIERAIKALRLMGDMRVVVLSVRQDIEDVKETVEKMKRFGFVVRDYKGDEVVKENVIIFFSR